jgi:hypothetical protein
MVTVALADLVVSATEVALIAKVAGVGTAEGAVYSPLAEIVPKVALPLAIPFTCQVTAVFVAPVTVAVNCAESPSLTVAEVGAILTLTTCTVTVALADFVPSATEVAVTVTVKVLVADVGAVYKPWLETLPHALPEHPVPEMLHVTEVFVTPLTVAVNCCVPPGTKLTVAGATCTVTNVVPLRDTDCGLPAALSAIAMLALRVPDAVGWKRILSVQLAFEARFPPPVGQVVEAVTNAKSRGFDPVIVMPEIAKGAEPLLVSVTLCVAPLVVNARLEGERLTAGA